MGVSDEATAGSAHGERGTGGVNLPRPPRARGSRSSSAGPTASLGATQRRQRQLWRRLGKPPPLTVAMASLPAGAGGYDGMSWRTVMSPQVVTAAVAAAAATLSPELTQDWLRELACVIRASGAVDLQHEQVQTYIQGFEDLKEMVEEQVLLAAERSAYAPRRRRR